MYVLVKMYARVGRTTNRRTNCTVDDRLLTKNDSRLRDSVATPRAPNTAGSPPRPAGPRNVRAAALVGRLALTRPVRHLTNGTRTRRHLYDHGVRHHLVIAVRLPCARPEKRKNTKTRDLTLLKNPIAL